MTASLSLIGSVLLTRPYHSCIIGNKLIKIRQQKKTKKNMISDCIKSLSYLVSADSEKDSEKIVKK